jgi:hypothetical protein
MTKGVTFRLLKNPIYCLQLNNALHPPRANAPPGDKKCTPFEVLHPPKMGICTPLGVSINILALIQIKEEIPKGISSFISCSAREGTRIIICGADERHRRGLDRAEP